MSFDDGSQDGFDIERIKARLRSELEARGIPFEKLCENASISPTEVLRALEVGTDGYPQTLHVFQRLSVALGHDPNWIPFGTEELPRGVADDDTRVRRLVWEFLYKAGIRDKEIQKRLLSAALESTKQKVAVSGTRYRSRQIRTLKDVVALYNEIIRQTGN